MNKEIKSKKNEKLKQNGLEKRKKWKNKSNMDSQKLCEQKLKKKYRCSSDDSIILLLQFRVLNSFDCIDLSDGIIKL